MKIPEINLMSVDKKMELASKSSDSIILAKLSKDPNPKVRRIIAKNRNVSKGIVNILARDPVLNVSYIAVNNPNCDIKRDFRSISHPCITCSEDERFMDCQSCRLVESFKKF